MAWLKSILYTWFKIFGISSPEDIAAERASRNASRRAVMEAEREREQAGMNTDRDKTN